jgi:hypothetical protein
MFTLKALRPEKYLEAAVVADDAAWAMLAAGKRSSHGRAGLSYLGERLRNVSSGERRQPELA